MNFSRFVSAMAILLASALVIFADMVVLKDGFILQGVVKRESVTEFDATSKEPIVIPKGFFMVDDGARRIYFNPNMVRVVEKMEAPQEERWVHQKSIYLPNAKGPPPFFSEVEATEWDAKWERTFKYRSPFGVVGVFQHMSSLTPYAARVDATSKYLWSCMYLTQELGPETCIRLIRSHPDFQNLSKKKPEESANLRFRLVDFLAQAGWFAESEKEARDIMKDFPEQKDRSEKAIETINLLRGRERIEKVKRIVAAQRFQEARKILDDFPSDEAKDKVLNELQAMQSKLDRSKQDFTRVQRLLPYLQESLVKKQQLVLAQATESILRSVHEGNLDRLEPFLNQAGNAESLSPDKDHGSLAALAISGWLLGSASADGNSTNAVRLWNTKLMVDAFFQEDSIASRKKILSTFLEKNPTSRLDEVSQILAQSLPSGSNAKNAMIFDRAIVRGRNKGLGYSVRVPKDFNPNRAYPLLIVFPKTGEKASIAMMNWENTADENGFIMAGFDWDQKNVVYGFTEKEHLEFLDMLRDLRLAYPVDSDRVFLFGYEQGGLVAFDMGISHPDQFAGVIPMSASPELFIEKYWRNAQYLPFYVVSGDRAGDANAKNRQLFTNWMPRGYPSMWTQYKGRGLEFFKAEVPMISDWMRLKTRSFPIHQLGSDGGGTVLGNEFQSSRVSDNQFYWMGSDSIAESRINYANNWKPNLSPASFTARVDPAINQITVRTHGMKDFYFLFGKNSKGESQIDFEKNVTIQANLISKWTGKIQPSLDTMLETALETGDRKNQVFVKFTMKP